LLAVFGVVLVLVPAAAAGPTRLEVLAATSLASVLPKIDPHQSYTSPARRSSPRAAGFR
jgi:hypothetical protein